MYRPSRRRLIALIIVCAVMLGGCAGQATQPRGDGPIRVVAGFFPLAQLAEAVGGRQVHVVDLTPAGAEAHDLELTPSQVDAVLDADLVLLVGGGFQPAVEEAAKQRDDGVVDLATGAGQDPHFWLDPAAFSGAISNVRDALSALDPATEQRFEAAARKYTTEISALDAEFRSGLADCTHRTFVTTHAAFGHLAEAYDLREESIAGLSPESEPDPGRLAELADRVRELGVTTVFVEPLAPPAAAETLAREADVAVAELDPLESRRPDTSSDYLTAMRANLAALRQGLGCR